MKKKGAAKLDPTDRKIVRQVAEVFRWLKANYPDLLPLYRKFLQAAMKKRFSESAAVMRRLRAEVKGRMAA